MALKGTKTEDNLKAAFAGESQANQKYRAFAKKAATFDAIEERAAAKEGREPVPCGRPRVYPKPSAGTVRAVYSNGLKMVYDGQRARITARPGDGD